MTKLRPAVIAYNHALTITGDKTIAESIAVASIRRGAQSRLAVTAHARYQALEHARHSPIAHSNDTAGPELIQLAQQLAHSRPVSEQALVDLESRYQFDNSSIGRVLGLSSQRTTARLSAVAKSWKESLDPAVMAWLGPASCEGLATVLTQAHLWPRSSDVPVISSVDTTGPIPLLSTGTDGALVEPATEIPPAISVVTIDALLACVPAIKEHSVECETCATRLEMLTPVRTLVTQTPLVEPPPSVTDVARNAYRRLPSALPPSIEPHRIDISRLRVPAFTVAALVVVLSIGGLLITNHKSGPSQADRVQRLVNTPNPSSLLATPTNFSVATKTAALANNGSQAITWNATTSVPWLTATPASGRLQPNQSVSVVINNNEPANNHNDATITITGSDGSTQTLQYKTAH